MRNSLERPVGMPSPSTISSYRIIIFRFEQKSSIICSLQTKKQDIFFCPVTSIPLCVQLFRLHHNQAHSKVHQVFLCLYLCRVSFCVMCLRKSLREISSDIQLYLFSIAFHKTVGNLSFFSHHFKIIILNLLTILNKLSIIKKNIQKR